MILIVEDDKNARHLFARILSKAGYQVVEAADGEEALALLNNRGGFELVMTDLVMPGLDGVKLANQIRLRWPETKIILMSGYLRRDAVHLLLNDNVDFLDKPIDLTSMIFKVARLAPQLDS